MRGTSCSFLRRGDGSTGNPTVVLVGPTFPLDQHLTFLPLKYLFYAKQGIVLQHFLGSTGQVTFLKGTMHFVETDTIPRLKFGSDWFLFQPLAVQWFPNIFFVVPRHVLGSHPNRTMTGGIVTFHESRQLIVETKGFGCREITIQPFFQRSVETLHQSRFGIPVRRKMADPVLLGPLFELSVVEFFASIRLQTVGFTPLTKDLVEGFDHGHPGFSFQRLYPRVLGRGIHDRHQVPNPAVALGQGLNFHQIGDPLIVQPTPGKVGK